MILTQIANLRLSCKANGQTENVTTQNCLQNPLSRFGFFTSEHTFSW